MERGARIEPAGGGGPGPGSGPGRGPGPGEAERTLWALVLRRLRGVGARGAGAGGRGSTPARERLCERLFGDVAGLLDAHARAETGAPEGARFYGVLARWLEARPAEARETLDVSREQWQQPYISLTMAALLHRWLFRALAEGCPGEPRAGGGGGGGGGGDLPQAGAVCLQGAENLFWADFKSAGMRFSEVFDFLADEVLLEPGYPLDAALELEGRQRLRRLVVRFLPYYRGDAGLVRALASVPLEAGEGGEGGGGGGGGEGEVPAPPSLEERGDFLLRELTAMLGSAKAEEGLALYLSRLQILEAVELGLAAASMVPTLRFQMRLHEMSRPGGPLYPPRKVRHAALGAYARLYPTGRHFRRMLKFSASIFHPADIPGQVAHSFRGGSALRRGAAGSLHGILRACSALLRAPGVVVGAVWGRFSDFLVLLWLLLWQMPRIRLAHWTWEVSAGARDLLGALVAFRWRTAPAV